jgi:hypothetical protein
MKRLFALAVASLVLSSPCFAADDESAEDGWIQMFDGKTLDGWKASEDGPDNWKVEDGAIVGRGSRGHLYYTGGDFKNFELRIEVKTEEKTNSGIYFHTKYQANGWPEQGYESQVNNTGGDPVKTGSVYNAVKVFTSAAEDDKWWTQTIIVRGKAVTTKIDGKTLFEFVEPEGAVGPRRLSEGTFALQQHDPGSVIRYRNIRVRKLP